MDSNASFAGEVERNVSRDNDSLLRGQFLKTPPVVVDQSGRVYQPSESARQRRGVATGMEQLRLQFPVLGFCHFGTAWAE
jgi:hypothetical protein